jgi:hypothetical protein
MWETTPHLLLLSFDIVILNQSLQSLQPSPEIFKRNFLYYFGFYLHPNEVS